MPDLVLPCLDEAAALPDLLARVPVHWHVILADNGSTDGSDRIAAAAGATVVRVPQRGYGAAAHAGLEAATSDVVGVMDADGTLDPGHLDALAAPVDDGRADLVLGRRRPVEPRAFPGRARLGNRYLAWEVRRRTGVRVHDVSPMRVARRDRLLALDLQDRRFGYPLELLATAAERGLRIEEVDVPYAARAAGSHSKVTGSWLGTIRTVRDMRRVLAS